MRRSTRIATAALCCLAVAGSIALFRDIAIRFGRYSERLDALAQQIGEAMNEEGTVTCVVECPALGVDQTVCTKRKAGESVQAWQARHFENVAAITAACNL